MLLYLFIVIVILCVIHVIFNYNERARMIKKIPGPVDHFIVGNGWTIMRPADEIMDLGRHYASKWDGIYRLWVYPYGAVVIFNPDDVEKILSSMKYGDKNVVYALLRPWLRDGLLISNGKKWQERRKILTPAFHFNVLKQFFEIIDDNTHRLVARINALGVEPIDVAPLLSEYALNSICETAMGTRLDEDTTGAAKAYKTALHNMGYLFYQRMSRGYLYPDFIFNLTSLGREQKKCLKIIQGFTAQVVQNRREYLEKNGTTFAEDSLLDGEYLVYNKRKRAAMLDLLISAEKVGLIDKAGIQEEVDTFMFEGHDTTSCALTFCLMLLANHRNIQDKIVEELKKILGGLVPKDSGRMEDLTKLKYLECCIKESLRLYPSVHFISRNLNETTTLSNYTVPAGTMCHIPIMDLHYRPALFKNPKQFDPERFFPENSTGRHPYAYIPFSAGLRNCIGQKFAMMEMKIAVVRLLSEFILEPVTTPLDIHFTADVVLRNKGPVFIKFVKRS